MILFYSCYKIYHQLNQIANCKHIFFIAIQKKFVIFRYYFNFKKKFFLQKFSSYNTMQSITRVYTKPIIKNTFDRRLSEKKPKIKRSHSSILTKSRLTFSNDISNEKHLTTDQHCLLLKIDTFDRNVLQRCTLVHRCNS